MRDGRKIGGAREAFVGQIAHEGVDIELRIEGSGAEEDGNGHTAQNFRTREIERVGV